MKTEKELLSCIGINALQEFFFSSLFMYDLCFVLLMISTS